jgi:hypothetical protein
MFGTELDRPGWVYGPGFQYEGWAEDDVVAISCWLVVSWEGGGGGSGGGWTGRRGLELCEAG